MTNDKCNCIAKGIRDADGYPVGEWMHLSTCPVHIKWIEAVMRANELIEQEVENDKVE